MASIKPPKQKSSQQPDSLESLASAKDEAADARNVTSRQTIRDKMQSDIEAFLAKGGEIEHLDIGMSAEKLAQQAEEARH